MKKYYAKKDVIAITIYGQHNFKKGDEIPENIALKMKTSVDVMDVPEDQPINEPKKRKSQDG